MADDKADDVNSEISLEEFDGEQETPKAEPSPVKESVKTEPEKPEVVKDTKEKVKGDDTPTPPDVPTKPEPDSQPKADEGEEEDKPQAEAPKPTKAEERKT